MNRRQFLQMSGAGLCAAALGEDGLSAARQRPLIRGTLWPYSARQSAEWKEEGWRKELERQRRIKFDLLWLIGTLEARSAMDDFTSLLALCERRNVKFLIDTGATADWYMTLDLKREKEIVSSHVAAMAPAVKDNSSFLGWYIPQEIYYCQGAFQSYTEDLYASIVDTCRKATPEIPVTISPFFILDKTKTFGDFYLPPPEEYARYWAALTKHAGFDIIMLQDSGEHFAYVTNQARRPYLSAMRDACRESGAVLWGNVECAEMNFSSIDEYVEVNGKVHHAVAWEKRWRLVPVDRLAEKLNLAAEYCDDFVTWGFYEFCPPGGNEEAARWFEDYRRYTLGG